ncbi:hypothetical protein D3C71_538120 [compost metagenome]
MVFGRLGVQPPPSKEEVPSKLRTQIPLLILTLRSRSQKEEQALLAKTEALSN